VFQIFTLRALNLVNAVVFITLSLKCWMFQTFILRLFHLVNIVSFYIKAACKKGGQSEPQYEVLECLTDSLTVLVSASNDGKEGEQFEVGEAGESLIVSAAASGVAFSNSATLRAVTLADGTQAFVAEDMKLDEGSVRSQAV
jgi:hypothetical protein